MLFPSGVTTGKGNPAGPWAMDSSVASIYGQIFYQVTPQGTAGPSPQPLGPEWHRGIREMYAELRECRGDSQEAVWRQTEPRLIFIDQHSSWKRFQQGSKRKTYSQSLKHVAGEQSLEEDPSEGSMIFNMALWKWWVLRWCYLLLVVGGQDVIYWFCLIFPLLKLFLHICSFKFLSIYIQYMVIKGILNAAFPPKSPLIIRCKFLLQTIFAMQIFT